MLQSQTHVVINVYITIPIIKVLVQRVMFITTTILQEYTHRLVAAVTVVRRTVIVVIRLRKTQTKKKERIEEGMYGMKPICHTSIQTYT